MARYEAPWDRSLKATTTVLLVVLACLSAGALVLYRSVPSGRDPHLLLLAPVVFAAVMAVTWALSPTGFAVEGGAVRVERPLRPVEIPLREIREVCLLPEAAMGGVIRTLGSSGAFGYVGWFWSRRLGAFRMYATRSRRLVRIVTARRTFVLSPEPVDQFVREVLERSTARTGTFR